MRVRSTKAAVVAAKVPPAVFCLLTALQFHELTTQLPRQIWIAMPRGSHAPHLDYPPIKIGADDGRMSTPLASRSTSG